MGNAQERVPPGRRLPAERPADSVPAMKTLPLFAALAALTLPLRAQKMQTPADEAPGPWLLGTIGVGKTEDPKIPKTTALKGLAIKVGEKGEAAVAYDLDLCRMAGAWTGKFTTPMNLMSRGEYPTALGEVAFTTGEAPGFLVTGAVEAAPGKTGAGGSFPGPAPSSPGTGGLSPGAEKSSPAAGPPSPGVVESFPRAGERSAGAWESSPASVLAQSNAPSRWQDPRPEPFGPLPPGQARFQGFYVNGGKTILKWDIGGTEVLEMPGYETSKDFIYFTRNFSIPASRSTIEIAVRGLSRPVEDTNRDVSIPLFLAEGNSPSLIFAFGKNLPANSRWSPRGETLYVSIPAPAERVECKIVVACEKPGAADGLVTEFSTKQIDLAVLTKGGPARWPEMVTTTGEVAFASGQSAISNQQSEIPAYVVDTIKLPDPNPWGAPMFVGGFDFFPDGRAAVCTFHGDVFVVSGLDAKLEQVTWKRFASGLYHALGLKIVNGEIFVTCRDGLWRLKDLNGDGECDFYEAFNHDVKVTRNFHEFVFDLQTDPAGNFYFIKAGPVKNGGRGFDPIMAHHGAMFRVSPDGGKFEVIATGFRAPNGIGVGPRGELTSGDNEGTWTPACKINWIKPGGFYGVVDLAHRAVPPTDYDRPLCWLPKRVDNSGGGQVWVPEGERWGPWGGKLLHLSYGQSSLYGVLKEEIRRDALLPRWRKGQAGEGGRASRVPNQTEEVGRAGARPSEEAIVQGGVVKFPLQFQSGIMRARFNPVDGQLYVAGLRGWQTNGLKNGCFQRVRYTGAVPRMPIAMHVKKDGIELRFACSLDTQLAASPDSWHLEQWRYLWSAAYGSPELSTVEVGEAPAEPGRDGNPQFTKAQMSKAAHDPVTVKSVSIGTDDRTVFLEIPGLKPVMQMAIKYDLKTSDGQDLRGEVVSTIHALGAD